MLAGASSTPKTYFACLFRGTLTKVGTKSPTCPPGAKVISWDQVGQTGAPGAKGDTGAIGPKGDTGTVGSPGVKGDTGAIGPQGVRGDTGPKGDTGATGAKGDTGPKGDAGTPAATSSQIVGNFPTPTLSDACTDGGVAYLPPEGEVPTPRYLCPTSVTIPLPAGQYQVAYWPKAKVFDLNLGWDQMLAGCKEPDLVNAKKLNVMAPMADPSGFAPWAIEVGAGGGSIIFRCANFPVVPAIPTSDPSLTQALLIVPTTFVG